MGALQGWQQVSHFAVRAAHRSRHLVGVSARLGGASHHLLHSYIGRHRFPLAPAAFVGFISRSRTAAWNPGVRCQLRRTCWASSRLARSNRRVARARSPGDVFCPPEPTLRLSRKRVAKSCLETPSATQERSEEQTSELQSLWRTTYAVL